MKMSTPCPQSSRLRMEVNPCIRSVGLTVTASNNFGGRYRFIKHSDLLRVYPFLPGRHMRPKLCAVNQKPLSEITASGPEGLILFGFPPEEVEMIQLWLAGADLKVVSGEGTLHRSSSVSDALQLLSGEKIFLNSTDDTFKCFSRVVLFCGLSGEVIEGLVEIWDESLSKGPISYAFASLRMMQENIETALLKVIQASDEKDLSEGWQVYPTSKQKLKNLVSNLKRASKTEGKPKCTESRGFGNPSKQ